LRLRVTVIGETVIFTGRLKFQMDLMLAGVAGIFGKMQKINDNCAIWERGKSC